MKFVPYPFVVFAQSVNKEILFLEISIFYACMPIYKCTRAVANV